VSQQGKQIWTVVALVVSAALATEALATHDEPDAGGR
jgi:hypothetical protein